MHHIFIYVWTNCLYTIINWIKYTFKQIYIYIIQTDILKYNTIIAPKLTICQ